jgi:hypothetical protein
LKLEAEDRGFMKNTVGYKEIPVCFRPESGQFLCFSDVGKRKKKKGSWCSFFLTRFLLPFPRYFRLVPTYSGVEPAGIRWKKRLFLLDPAESVVWNVRSGLVDHSQKKRATQVKASDSRIMSDLIEFPCNSCRIWT